jgi:hypothetical protein
MAPGKSKQLHIKKKRYLNYPLKLIEGQYIKAFESKNFFN